MSAIRSLPLFPLELVLYPRERLPLHIFEPRYKEMAQYCMREDRPFGVVLSEDEEIEEVGTTARIARVINRYDDGRMDLLVVGQKRFRIDQIYEERSYLTADVETLEETEEPVERGMRERAITQHMKLLELVGHTVRPSLYENVDRLSYLLAQNAGLEAQQKQRVLEMPSENERIAYLVRHFESLIPRVEEQESVRRRIQSDGHFKDFPSIE